jgi:N-acetylglucosaminyl-diphospho-decaprenol L-rhamnosyltransferase
MVLSVIIVNYRVRYFLELCLHSVKKAISGLAAEVIIIDNDPADGTIAALQPLFPDFLFLPNTENLGFAKANNQALSHARGEYILFLNPDTLLPEDFVRICHDFITNKPDAGGLGVRMVDGSGRFLKESRRGFPGPWVAFCKLSGLSALFPHSRFFARYYLGHLRSDTAHPAPVLSGACLWVSRAILRETGGFDERFFMYAEDIDLSFRIEKAGYVNYYLPDTTIIHFKGESTQKDIRYVRQFYKAMSQFRRKHFNRGLPKLLNAGMETAIWLRAGVGGLARIPPKATRVPPQTKPRTWLTGDPASVNRAKLLLTSTGQREIAPTRETATEIIFCEGPDFSFRECIAALEAAALYRSGQQAKFHAAGSNSATGSPDRDGRGETLVF